MQMLAFTLVRLLLSISVEEREGRESEFGYVEL